ncbi:MAG: DMT family transporter [Anaerovoracaceae bacterium]
MNKRATGVATAIISAVVFGMVPLFMKTIIAGGGTTLSGAFYRFVLSLPILFAIIKYKKIPMGITGTEFMKICLITICGYGGTAVLLFSSYNFIPTGMSTTIHFVYPVFTILGCIIFLKERVRPLKILCALLCMCGILLFYEGDSASSLPGIGLAFLSGMTYSFYIIYLKKSGLQEMDTIKLIFYMNSVASVMILIMAVASGSFTVNLTTAAWVTAAIFAAVVSLVGVFGFQLGVKYVGPESAAILSTFEPITSVVIGVMLYDEVFSAKAILGCACILSSVVIVAKMKE